jgi:hypothetical protein
MIEGGGVTDAVWEAVINAKDLEARHCVLSCRVVSRGTSYQGVSRSVVLSSCCIQTAHAFFMTSQRVVSSAVSHPAATSCIEDRRMRSIASRCVESHPVPWYRSAPASSGSHCAIDGPPKGSAARLPASPRVRRTSRRRRCPARSWPHSPPPTPATSWGPSRARARVCVMSCPISPMTCESRPCSARKPSLTTHATICAGDDCDRSSAAFSCHTAVFRTKFLHAHAFDSVRILFKDTIFSRTSGAPQEIRTKGFWYEGSWIANGGTR